MKGPLRDIFPALTDIKLPFSRDQFFLLLAGVNEIFLGIDIYLAHKVSGTIVFREWIPIIFGPVAGVLIFLAGWIALRKRGLATVIANIVFMASIAVGLLGAYYHVVRAILPTGPPGEQVTVSLLVWAPPVVGPLVFSLVGLIGISAVWIEEPVNSGRLRIFGNRHLLLPYSKTRAYFFMVSLGTLATLLSSQLDHARTDFKNPWLWVPIAVGAFGVIVAAAIALISSPRREDYLIYTGAMLALIAVGLIGTVLHIKLNLTAGGQFVSERFIRGAPFLAPMLYADMGTLGLLVLLDPKENPTG